MEDKPRFRVGDFFGIIIPGALLLANLYVLFGTKIVDVLKRPAGTEKLSIAQDVIMFVVFSVVAYSLGTLVRLLPPAFPDRVSAWSRMTWRCCGRLSPLYWIHNARLPRKQLWEETVGLNESFPYLNWFINCGPRAKYFPKYVFQEAGKDVEEMCAQDSINSPKLNVRQVLAWSIKALFLTIILCVATTRLMVIVVGLLAYVVLVVGVEFLCLKPAMNRRDEKHVDSSKAEPFACPADHFYFFNYCKLVVADKSSALREEVLFAEGLSRMVIGITYSAFLSLFAIVMKKYSDPHLHQQTILSLIGDGNAEGTLLRLNLLLSLGFVWGVHHVRVKEATTVFNSYAIVKSDTRDKDV